MLDTLVALWNLLRDGLSDADSKLLGEIYAGQLDANQNHAWAQTNKDDEHQDVVNLTLELTAMDLQLNLVGGTTPQREQLERWIKPIGSKFWNTHPDWELVVFIRRAPGEGFFIGAPWEEQARYSADEVIKKGFVSIRSTHGFGLDSAKKRLAYHLRRSWLRDEALDAGNQLVPMLASSVQDILPDLRQARNTTT